jgi:hypothetical protein
MDIALSIGILLIMRFFWEQIKGGADYVLYLRLFGKLKARVLDHQKRS